MSRLHTPAIAAAAAALLSACVISPYPRAGGYAAYPSNGGGYAPYPAEGAYSGNPGSYPGSAPIAVVDMPPPPPQVEVIPAIPFAGAIWLSGYWGWHAGRHVWVGGNWSAQRPGYVYNPHRWIATQGRWHLMPGHWDRR